MKNNMKNLNTYITEKILINKDIKIPHKLDKIYDNIDELVDDLNDYFGNQLEEQIKVIRKSTKFTSSVKLFASCTVRDYFIIKLKDVDAIFQFGKIFNDELISQCILKDYKGKADVWHTYKFKKDNFYKWICQDKQEEYSMKEFFNIKDDK